TPPRLTTAAPRSAASSRARTALRSRLTGPCGFRTKSIAPNSRARIVRSVLPPAPAALSMTTGRGDSAMMYPSVWSPSSTGISISSVTISGSNACTWRRASSPSRAVPTTRNSSDAPAMRSVMTLRMKALSSTTSTVRTRGCLEDTVAVGQRSDDHVSVGHVQEHAPPIPAANVLGHDRHSGLDQRAPRRLDVALAHVDAADGKERAKHAGPAGQLGREWPACAQLPHLVEQKRHGG